MCAAVADYTPKSVADHKLKKSDDDLTIELCRTKDIAKELGSNKGNRTLVGFALETDNERANAEGKLQRKNLDFVVLNSLRDKGAGFGGDTNKITIIDHNSREEHPLMSKHDTAKVIVDKIERVTR
jgi:phosphopantothenoylcysteine decarboxylase/phosphopantothenate--cysteine ligase